MSPAKKSARFLSMNGRIIGIVGEVFLDAHTSIPGRLLLQVRAPGLDGCNFEDDLGSRPSFADTPTSHPLEIDAFDDCDVRSQRLLFVESCLIEVEVFIDGTWVGMKEPGEYLHEVAH